MCASGVEVVDVVDGILVRKSRSRIVLPFEEAKIRETLPASVSTALIVSLGNNICIGCAGVELVNWISSRPSDPKGNLRPAEEGYVPANASSRSHTIREHSERVLSYPATR